MEFHKIGEDKATDSNGSSCLCHVRWETDPSSLCLLQHLFRAHDRSKLLLSMFILFTTIIITITSKSITISIVVVVIVVVVIVVMIITIIVIITANSLGLEAL